MKQTETEKKKIYKNIMNRRVKKTYRKTYLTVTGIKNGERKRRDIKGTWDI